MWLPPIALRTSSLGLTRSRTTSGPKPRSVNSWTTPLIDFLSLGGYSGQEVGKSEKTGTHLAVVDSIFAEVWRQREEKLLVRLGEVHAAVILRDRAEWQEEWLGGIPGHLR